MTEPRKTPRTTALDVANDDESLCETAYDKMHALARALEAETQELAEALEKLYSTTASLRFDANGRQGWKFVAETSAWKLNTVALVKAEQLVLARHRAKQEVQS